MNLIARFRSINKLGFIREKAMQVYQILMEQEKTHRELTTEIARVLADLLDVVQVVGVSTHALLLVPWAVLWVHILTIS